MKNQVIPLNQIHKEKEFHPLLSNINKIRYLRRLGILPAFRYTPNGRLYVRRHEIEKLIKGGKL